MAKDLVINNQNFEYPDNGENPGYGEDATEWAEAVTDLLNTLQGSNDVPLTTTTLLNDQLAPINIPGLAFNLTVVNQFRIEYTIRRFGTTTTVETGFITGTYDGSSIFLTQELTSDDTTEDSGIVFSVTVLGQFQYTSTDFPGHTTLPGDTIVFKATTMSN